MSENGCDIILSMVRFFDPHLLIQILNLVAEAGFKPLEDVARERSRLYAKTDMVLGDITDDQTIPPHLQQRVDEVKARLEEQLNEVKPLLIILDNDDQREAMMRNSTMLEMAEQCQLKSDIFDQLYLYAQSCYRVGNYELAGGLLGHYRTLLVHDPEPDQEKLLRSTWGLLANHILMMKWDEAADMALRIEDLVSNGSMPQATALTHRAWLAHWQLFILFKSDKHMSQPSKLADSFMSEKSLHVISTAAPHLFRYVAAYLVLNKRLQPILRSVVGYIGGQSHVAKDPTCEFLLSLYGDLDFTGANKHFTAATAIFATDVFLSAHEDAFCESARLHIFEVYCRVHSVIDISMISEKFNMTTDEAELWIVKLIQNARMTGASIDSEKRQVIMGSKKQDVYSRVVEETKDAAFRSMLLQSNITKAQGGAVLAR